jgi:glycopeptide antibiotics resistance protein
MIGYSPVYPQPFLVGLPLLALVLILLRRRRTGPLYLLGVGLFGFYLIGIVNLVFFPILLPPNWPEGVTLEGAQRTFSHVNLIPFYYGDMFTLNFRTIIYEIAGNFLLTVPFGFGLPFLARLQAKRMPWLALGVGLTFEITQLALALILGSYARSVDINDVLLNAAGVLFGYGFWRLLTRFSRAKPLHLSNS